MINGRFQLSFYSAGFMPAHEGLKKKKSDWHAKSYVEFDICTVYSNHSLIKALKGILRVNTCYALQPSNDRKYGLHLRLSSFFFLSGSTADNNPYIFFY